AATEGYPLPISVLAHMLRNPSSSEAHCALAESLLARNALVLTEVEATVACNLGSEESRARYLLGYAQALRGSLSEAETNLRRALALDPQGGFSARARWML